MSHFYTRRTTDDPCRCGCNCGEVIRRVMSRRGKQVEICEFCIRDVHGPREPYAIEAHVNAYRMGIRGIGPWRIKP